MTHSGGKPHAVGDRGQRFEVSAFDTNAGKRVVVGWSDDQATASRMGDGAMLRPSWSCIQVTDRIVDRALAAEQLLREFVAHWNSGDSVDGENAGQVDDWQRRLDALLARADEVLRRPPLPRTTDSRRESP